MKSAVWLVLALALTTIPVTAQEATGDPLLEDPSGDVAIETSAGTAASPTAGDRVDVLSLHLTETRESIDAVVTLAAIDSDAQVVHNVRVDFDYAGRGHRLVAYGNLGSTEYFGYLAIRDDGTGRYSSQQSIATSTDAAAGTVRMSVPRELVFGADGAPLVPDRALEDVHVRSEGNAVSAFNINGQTSGRAGFVDEAGGDARLVLRFGVEQDGHARLGSDAPFRSSNGAATTFVFRVEARNLADAADSFALAAEGVPSGWDVDLPAARLHLEAGEAQTVPVIVRTPFVHQHGSAESFLLQMTSDTDPGSVGRIEIGVRYPEIPQPAGHHDTLWLHGVAARDDPLTTGVSLFTEALVGYGEYGGVVMNAVEDDERIEDVPIEGYVCGTDSNGTSPFSPTYCWDVFLDPGLDMGLDFDLRRAGSVEAPVHALVPTDGARLAGHLVWFGPPEQEEDEYGFSYTSRESVVLADVVGGEARDVGADGEALLEATVVPRAEADLVRYQKGAGIMLRLELETRRVDYTILGPHMEPELLPGGLLRLPLNEYADPVDELFAGSGSLRVDAVTEQERLLNPGDTAVFTVDVVHAGDGKDSYSARVVGGNAEWSSLLGPTTFTLRENGTQRLSVSVLAPADARDGDQADLVLEVASNSELGARAVVRLVATVDTDEEHPDDAAQAAALAKRAGKSSPGPGGAAPLLALAAAAALAARGPRRT